MNIKIDYLIVGQGLAGTLLAYFLRKRGLKVLILDNSHQHAASVVAAGLINPITGRRFVKSWRIDSLLPFAFETYQALEAELGCSFLRKRPIIRALFSVKEDNDWLAKASDPEFAPYMAIAQPTISYSKAIRPSFSLAETTGSAQLETGTFLPAFRKRAESEGWLRSETFEHAALELKAEGVQYKDIEASRIVFCEGIGVLNNPHFSGLPIEGAKGEVLIVRIPEFPAEAILKHKIFLAPLGNTLFWAGATYDWGCPDDLPTAEKRSALIKFLDEILTIPYEVVDHLAAIRPTVKDRRPILGIHAEHPQLVLFNGLGTKGASLAPFWANHFAEVLTGVSSMEGEVDLARFYH